MPVYRVVLFHTKAGTTEEQKTNFIEGSKNLRGKVPGLISLEVGPALDMARTHGYDMGIILCLEAKEYLSVFAKHPGHLALHDIREAISEDSLAFNLEF